MEPDAEVLNELQALMHADILDENWFKKTTQIIDYLNRLGYNLKEFIPSLTPVFI